MPLRLCRVSYTLTQKIKALKKAKKRSSQSKSRPGKKDKKHSNKSKGKRKHKKGKVYVAKSSDSSNIESKDKQELAEATADYKGEV
ncbi:hypothetical protein Tdes44962_MAKER07656 [Teratosphaeria destructans]|uniref:Uncharacterized protein n=1 Tax=Teratosphaeria destructans TaxID=418781 RepID=A0A9W7SY84_9PEZI|nr:hypothetical protein Tdes44962_MAKER07656 [Teratosphaeria destructans]